MAVVRLRAPLSELVGGSSHSVDGSSVAAVLRKLEATHPAVSGWILDERGYIRRHINVFVNGDRANETTAVDEGDRVYVLNSITGG